jgi:hypothetical protein
MVQEVKLVKIVLRFYFQQRLCKQTISNDFSFKISKKNIEIIVFPNGKKYLLPHYVWTYFNRNNQTFTKFRNILKEYFLKLRIGF